MSKEKTRAELHAEVADLKAKLENEVKHAADLLEHGVFHFLIVKWRNRND